MAPKIKAQKIQRKSCLMTQDLIGHEWTRQVDSSRAVCGFVLEINQALDRLS